MNFVCQSEAIFSLNTLAASDRHSVLIHGCQGCGKTKLAQKYADILNVPDFQIVSPKVDEIRSVMDTCYNLNNPIVICIENLDTGVSSASYTLLKFLEEPASNVYVIVTCRNINTIPDTIVSRSACVVTSPPTDRDIDCYANDYNTIKYAKLKKSLLWRCVRTFTDVETVLNMSPNQVEYFNSLAKLSNFDDSIANMAWAIGHYPDKTDTPLEIVIRYILELVNDPYVRRWGIECISELYAHTIASHAAICNFLFKSKYLYKHR